MESLLSNSFQQSQYFCHWQNENIELETRMLEYA